MKPVQGPEDWCDMLRFSGSSQNPGSSVLDELQLSNGLLWKETITIIHPAGDKGMNKFLQVLTGNKNLIIAMFLR